MKYDFVTGERMKQLIRILTEASKVYYSGKSESMISDAEYDKYLGELSCLEKKSGIQLIGSPTIKVGYLESDGDKYEHPLPILSLKSTKDIDEIETFIGDKKALLSWKLDGISIVLYYSNGKLQRALSRGDGQWGKDITKNVKLLKNVPLEISMKNDLIIRGEGCLSLKEFDLLRKTEEGESYKNPRNLAAGLINSTKTTSILLRHMNFIAHSIVLIDGPSRQLSLRSEQFEYLKSLGFEIVDYYLVDITNVKDEIIISTREVDIYPYPVDGLVLIFDDLEYSDSLGSTARFPKHSLAFKWPDEVKETKVTGMIWSVSQTGLITPIVQFEPILLEGTTVKQANLHSLKIFEGLAIGKGDILRVYKANKIVPEIEENLTRSKTEEYPKNCPVCNQPTFIVVTEKSEKLYCPACGKFE